jgi:hypothetical protein
MPFPLEQNAQRVQHIILVVRDQDPADQLNDEPRFPHDVNEPTPNRQTLSSDRKDLFEGRKGLAFGLDAQKHRVTLASYSGAYSPPHASRQRVARKRCFLGSYGTTHLRLNWMAYLDHPAYGFEPGAGSVRARAWRRVHSDSGPS